MLNPGPPPGVCGVPNAGLPNAGGVGEAAAGLPKPEKETTELLRKAIDDFF